MDTYTLIIAEDEQMILDDIADEVERSDLGFLVAGKTFNGADALKLVRSLRPDVLLTDVKMPVMDGLELAERARAENPDLLIVIISGYDDFAYAQKAIKCGVSDYLQKPLSENALRETLMTLRQTIDRRRKAALSPISINVADATFVSQKVIEAERYIREHFSEKIDFERLLSALNYNVAYLGRAFRKRFGSTPQQYQRQLRIDEAMRLIAAYPELDVNTVGQIVGYGDGHYFSRVFKATTGKSPTEYRNSINTN